MANVLVFHYREAKAGKPVLAALKAAGHRVVDAVPEYPDFQPSVEICKPEVIVVEASHRFNNGIEAADYVTNLKAYQGVPVLLVNAGEPARSLASSKLQEATFVEEPDAIVQAVQAALAGG